MIQEAQPEEDDTTVEADLPEIDPEAIVQSLNPERLKELFGQVFGWMQNNILTLDSALQAGLITVSILTAVLLYRLIRGFLNQISEGEETPQIAKRAVYWLKPMSWPIMLLIFFLAVQYGLEAFGRPALLPRAAVNLTLAWIVIRLASSLIREPFWARTVALIAWSIAALSVFGLLDPVTRVLDAIGISIGEARVSPLSVIQGLITGVIFIGVALWLSRFLKDRIDHLPSLTPSVRILLSRALQLVLITVAFLIALTSIGFPLAALAVFSGAVGLGIGFGLQKIFSNLVSGVILLLDRSIKPGDVIQVDETYGYVKSLGLRYASVVTRDNHEHLIPNEEFIIHKLVNWSFSDRAVRIKKEVGVAYDADVHLARQLMIEAAQSVDRVIDHPKPVCLLTDFGDSAVILEVRFWISDPQNGVRNVTSEVLLAIWDAFHENDISIPFPQRDLHLKSSESGVLTVAQGKPPEPKAKPAARKPEPSQDPGDDSEDSEVIDIDAPDID